MNTNKRIARGLGTWYWPDYEHSLDALLEPLGVLRERGWTWECGIDGIGQPWGLLRREGQYLPHRALD